VFNSDRIHLRFDSGDKSLTIGYYLVDKHPSDGTALKVAGTCFMLFNPEGYNTCS